MELAEFMKENGITSIADHEPSFQANAIPGLLKVNEAKGLVPEESVSRPFVK